MSEIKIIVLDSYGIESKDVATVKVTGNGVAKIVHLSGMRGFVDLPFGTYLFECSSREAVTSARVVEVDGPKLQVVFGLSLLDPGQMIGEGQHLEWAVSGRVEPRSTPGPVIVKLVGIFSSFSREAEADERGRFSLSCDGQGLYLFLAMFKGKIVFQRTLDISLAGPISINLGIIGR
jgi:hypothetical protein